MGMDVSGDPENTNYNYLGVVLGTAEGIVNLSLNNCLLKSDYTFGKAGFKQKSKRPRRDLNTRLNRDRVEF